MIGAAYIRVSTDRQDEYSPASQLKLVREYAEKEGYTIPDDYVFYDDGISGRSVKKRDDFNKMISLAKDKERPFDRIYVYRFSRFARNQEESIVYKNLLQKRGVTVKSVSEPIPEGHFGTLIERIIEWMDEFYSINLATEVRRGMVEKVSRGEPTCAPPFGYVMKDGVFVVDEEKADIVREIFEMYASGVKQRKIATLLTERGVVTRYGNPLEKRWVDYVLHNSTYIGMIRFSTDGSRAVSKGKLDSDNIMEVKGQHQPIISMDIWNTVQNRLEEQKKAYPKYARKDQEVQYMLKGLVRCSSCGGSLSASSKSKSGVLSLQCCNYAHGKCDKSHSITLPVLEKAVIDGIEKAVKDMSFTIAPVTLPKKAIDYDKLIAIEMRRLERVREAYLAEIDTLEQYANNKKEINKKIAELTKQRDTPPTPPRTAQIAKKAIVLVEYLQNDKVSPRAKNEALRAIISHIVYDKANKSLAIYFHDN